MGGRQSHDSRARSKRRAGVIRDFPDLSREDIRARLALAADRERRLDAAVSGRLCTPCRGSVLV